MLDDLLDSLRSATTRAQTFAAFRSLLSEPENVLCGEAAPLVLVVVVDALHAKR